ncbi:hypothetical protein BofuT4_uP129090.1 [Botrytis cinerea T4]|uniref:Uncharacterized protein n=1 Tax=Botryotinia fuckeliana (strain T4) TaxID=999810 RepID=G2YRG1_BOTF4|nr:hypothetical protein BofuT4_uP129090.1 [Botrytis cinerea T4]
MIDDIQRVLMSDFERRLEEDNQQLVSYFVTIPVNGANERQTGYRVSLEKPGHLRGERCSIEKAGSTSSQRA